MAAFVTILLSSQSNILIRQTDFGIQCYQKELSFKHNFFSLFGYTIQSMLGDETSSVSLSQRVKPAQ